MFSIKSIFDAVVVWLKFNINKIGQPNVTLIQCPKCDGRCCIYADDIKISLNGISGKFDMKVCVCGYFELNDIEIKNKEK